MTARGSDTSPRRWTSWRHAPRRATSAFNHFRPPSALGLRPHLINGIHLGIIQRGDPAGVPLVLLHGFTGSAAGWGAHLDRFADMGMRVVALDMLGHGASAAPDDPARYSIEYCRDDILAALASLHLVPEQAFLLGYSLGGRVALFTALEAAFRGLILESASPGIADPAERAARRASDAELAARIQREGVPAFVEYWTNIPLFASQRSLPVAVQSEIRTQRLRNSASGLANSLRGVGTGSQPALHARLAHLACPTLLIAGALDAKYAAIAQEMHTAIPHSTVQIVPNAGHTVHLERPQLFDELVNHFCQHHNEVQP
jgi:2-succinyl-6-hydroxy-2,4-cyclohexadiene-1-carboxylate synthase